MVADWARADGERSEPPTEAAKRLRPLEYCGAVKGAPAWLDWIWGLLAAIALWWPAHVRGPLDGAPLDRPLEALLLGLVFPALWWFHPAFLRQRLVRAAIAILLLTKVGTSFLAPAGWCVRFDPPAPIVRDSTGRPHSWDLRADWLSPNPECSAVMTRGYEEFKHFPVWFYNLPPVDDGWPSANDRPPYVVLPMSVVGFIEPSSAGVLEVQLGPAMDVNIVVDGVQAETVDPYTRRIDLNAGVHFVQISGTLTGNRWRLLPLWSGTPMGSMFFPAITLTPPSRLDGLNGYVLRWLALVIVAILMAGWIGAALAASGHIPSIVWAVAAASCLALIGARESSNLAASPLARWSITALALSLAIPMPERLRSTRGAFLLIGVPWLAFIAAGFFVNIGRFSFYTGGEDSWTYQRYAYAIFMQEQWIRGGSATFYFQPLYRWTIGALHLLFGDSSVGEFYADGACLLAAALFSYRVVTTIAGHRWGVVGAVSVLTLVLQGPTFGFVGRGLTDISSMGLIYMSALFALNRQPDGTFRLKTAMAASSTAALAFYTRLNNFPVALSVASMAVPLEVPARALWSPMQTARRTSWFLVAGFVGTLAVALILFALHTWYYAGVFSITHGTSFGMNKTWQPDLPVAVNFQRMIEGFGVLLTLNDPPRFSLYSIPLLIAGVAAVAAIVGIKGFRELPLSVVLFFLGCVSIATVVRGIAYSGRYSTHLLGAACTLAVLVVARLVGWGVRVRRDT
jgi:hypothetical protein